MDPSHPLVQDDAYDYNARKCYSQPIPGQKPGDFQSDTKINIKFTIRYSINQLLLLLLRTKSC